MTEFFFLCRSTHARTHTVFVLLGAICQIAKHGDRLNQCAHIYDAKHLVDELKM